MTRYLFDASSIFEALVRGRAEVLSGNFTLELARYELGNVVWKRRSLIGDLSREDALRILGLFKKALRIMEVLRVECREAEILKIAEDLGMTFYDACYVAIASIKDAALITEDKKLKRKAEKLVKVAELDELLGNSISTPKP